MIGASALSEFSGAPGLEGRSLKQKLKAIVSAGYDKLLTLGYGFCEGNLAAIAAPI